MLLGDNVSESKLLELTENNEGYRQFPYSCTAGKQTIGIGLNLDDVGISHEEAVVILKMRMSRIEHHLNAVIPCFGHLDQARRAAICDMTFQLGLDGLLGFKKSLAFMNNNEFTKAADEFLNSRWARQTPQRAKKITGMIRTGEWPS